MKKTFTLMTFALGATLVLGGCKKPTTEATAVIKVKQWPSKPLPHLH
ncbi:MAG: hypothetical protein WBJ28_04735 [Bacilli bacterium]